MEQYIYLCTKKSTHGPTPSWFTKLLNLIQNNTISQTWPHLNLPNINTFSNSLDTITPYHLLPLNKWSLIFNNSQILLTKNSVNFFSFHNISSGLISLIPTNLSTPLLLIFLILNHKKRIITTYFILIIMKFIHLLISNNK